MAPRSNKSRAKRRGSRAASSRQSPEGGTTRARWSGRVTETSQALDLEAGVFTWQSPRRIALSLKQSAEASRHRKAGAFRSAMSMLSFFLNRGGANLSVARRRILNQAKQELRRLFGRKPASSKAAR